MDDEQTFGDLVGKPTAPTAQQQPRTFEQEVVRQLEGIKVIATWILVVLAVSVGAGIVAWLSSSS